jgi:nitrile hydratase accessory protein|tara:strand:+ start:1635 stop:1973 length:339 start_codon:yes stop_codon:yes gene_type:complete
MNSISSLDGSNVEPPRENGELVFQEPWEARAFGLAVALAETEALSWEFFRKNLIVEVAAKERSLRDGGEAWSYYESWLKALEKSVIEGAIVKKSAIAERCGSYAARPHGHDH